MQNGSRDIAWGSLGTFVQECILEAISNNSGIHESRFAELASACLGATPPWDVIQANLNVLRDRGIIVRSWLGYWHFAPQPIPTRVSTSF